MSNQEQKKFSKVIVLDNGGTPEHHAGEPRILVGDCGPDPDRVIENLAENGKIEGHPDGWDYFKRDDALWISYNR